MVSSEVRRIAITLGRRAGKSYMSDIFKSWKEEKFIVADKRITGDLTDKIIVVMSDYRYWAAHVDECEKWCKQYNCEIKGMTIEIPDEDTLLLFVLRWS